MTEEQIKPEEKPASVVKTEERKDFLKEARELAETIKEGNAESKRLIEEQKEILATNLLSGNADVSKPEVKKEMTDAEYKDEVMAGRVPQK